MFHFRFIVFFRALLVHETNKATKNWHKKITRQPNYGYKSSLSGCRIARPLLILRVDLLGSRVGDNWLSLFIVSGQAKSVEGDTSNGWRVLGSSRDCLSLTVKSSAVGDVILAALVIWERFLRSNTSESFDGTISLPLVAITTRLSADFHHWSLSLTYFHVFSFSSPMPPVTIERLCPSLISLKLPKLAQINTFVWHDAHKIHGPTRRKLSWWVAVGQGCVSVRTQCSLNFDDFCKRLWPPLTTIH